MSVVARLDTKALDKLRAELRPRARVLVHDTAFRIERDAKMLAPVDTGFLRTSIGAQMTGELSAVVSVGAEYGLYQELGTSKMPAQPFLTPAVEQNRADFEQGCKELADA